MDDDADMKLPASTSAEEGDMDLDGAPLNDSIMSSQSQSQQQPQSFTPLQSRRLPQPAYSATLCPSMDLIVMGLGSGGHGHHHHHGSGGGGAGGHHHHHHGHSAPRDYSYLDQQNLSSGGGGGNTNGGGRNGGRAGSLLAGMDSATATFLDNLHLAASPSVSVHRTISWQKLFTLGTADLTSPPPDEYDEKVQGNDDGEGDNDNSGDNDDMEQDTDNEGKPKNDDEEDDDDIVLPFGGGRYNAKGGDGDDDDDNDEAGESSTSADPNATAPKGCTALCWSPDGRSFAIGLADGGVLVHDVERSMDGGVGGAVHSLPPGPVRMAPPLPSPSPEDMAAAATTAAASDMGASLKTPAKPVKVTTRSMTASRRLRSGRRGAGTTGAGTASASARGAGGFSAGAVSDDDTPQPMPAMWKKGAVTGLSWSRVSPPHPSWEMTETEEEREDAWRYRSHYLDKSSILLPPCAYNPSLPNDENFPPSHPHHHGSNVATDDEEADEALLDRMARPTCRTPLSVLFVTTCANGTSLYLHGRYRILTLAPPAHAAFNARARTVCSTDLGTFLTAYTALPPASATSFAGGAVSPSSLKTVLSLYTAPAIPQHRYELQTISSLYCSIMAHIRAIGKGLQEASSTWNGALRQLDQKFDQVVNLLRNYGALAVTEVPVDASTTVKGNAVRSALRNYIISARSQRYASAASALDQFFGAPLMNDQLLQRMIRALEASARSVEGQLRKDVLAPCRSLVWDSSELKGLVGAMSTTSLYGDQLEEPALAYSLCYTVENLRLTIETCLRDMIDIRCRLQDVLGWIRSTASAVKAKDTAKDSALRENARKRRVDDSVAKRVAGYFAGDITPRATDIDITKRSISECILGITVSDYFGSSSAREDTEPVSWAEQGRSSIKDLLGGISTNVVQIFQQPRKSLMDSAEQIDIEIIACGKEKKASTAMSKPMAIHSRVGAGSSDSNDKSASGCFRPRLDDAEKHFQSPVDQCRHWMIIAKVGEALVRERPVIQIAVLPCVAFGSRSPFDDDSDAILPTYYLESFVFLPPGCSVSSIEFYGDDGSSSPGASIAETVAEGRQGLGILVERSVDGQVSEELFLFSYDELSYRYVDQLKLATGSEEKSKCLLVQEFNPSEDLNSARFTCSIGDDRDDGFHEDFGIERHYCKHRILRIYPKLFSNKSLVAGNQATRFVLGGSRGVGGIFSEAASSMELYDLEEDEEEEEGGEEGQ